MEGVNNSFNIKTWTNLVCVEFYKSISLILQDANVFITILANIK